MPRLHERTSPRGSLLVVGLLAPLLSAPACENGVYGADGQRLGGTGDASRVGFPCLPSDELDPSFAGFDSNAITIEAGNPSCGAGVCVVDRFQGRVCCPEGQAEPRSCADDEDCPGSSCDDGFCVGSCFAGDQPVTSEVCGQCTDRTVTEAVHCSCLCGPPPGDEPDPGKSYCTCPGGFTCEAVARWGDLAGSYCVREPPTSETSCGVVNGHWAPQCDGLPSP